jgi:hypothetical protein
MTNEVVREAAEQVADAYPDTDAAEVIDLIEDLIENAQTEKSGFTYEELEENLPEDIYDAVMSHLDGGPESAHEVAMKAVRGEDHPTVEVTDGADESVAERVEKADTDESPSLNTAYRNEEDVE